MNQSSLNMLFTLNQTKADTKCSMIPAELPQERLQELNSIMKGNVTPAVSSAFGALSHLGMKPPGCCSRMSSCPLTAAWGCHHLRVTTELLPTSSRSTGSKGFCYHHTPKLPQITQAHSNAIHVKHRTIQETQRSDLLQNRNQPTGDGSAGC